MSFLASIGGPMWLAELSISVSLSLILLACAIRISIRILKGAIPKAFVDRFNESLSWRSHSDL